MEWEKEGNERGAVMLEGVFGILVSILVMALLLSLGFYLYQRTVVRIVANEIAEEVAITYKLRNVGDSTSISLNDITGIGKYRYYLFANTFTRENEAKATALAGERLPKTALAKADGAPEVEITVVKDDVGRMHYEVTLRQDYTFLLGKILNLLGIEKSGTLSSTVYVEAVDISYYINTVKMTNYGLEKFTDAISVLKAVDSVVKLMKSVYGIFT